MSETQTAEQPVAKTDGRFIDSKGRTWIIEITVADIKSVRKAFGIDLFKAFDNNMDGWAKLIEDPSTLVDVIFFLIQEQAKAISPPVSDIDFGRSLKGDVIKDAANAFTDALIAFFPKARSRETIRAVLEKSEQLREIQDKEILEAIHTVNVEKLARNTPVTNAPASLASTPAHTA